MELAPSETISELLKALRQGGATCARVARVLSTELHLGERAHAALASIAVEADRSGVANPYHNPAHTRDVIVCWANLAVLNNHLVSKGRAGVNLDREALAAGLYAAAGHDLLHDGGTNLASDRSDPSRATWISFRLESISADRTASILGRHGIDAKVIAIVVASILATDVRTGRAALEQSFEGAAAGAFTRSQLDALCDPVCRLVAAILRDADLLPSAGLSADDHDRQSALLGAELHQALDRPEAAEVFLAKTGHFLSPPGRLFQHRLEEFRAVNRLRHPAESLAEAARRVAGL